MQVLELSLGYMTGRMHSISCSQERWITKTTLLNLKLGETDYYMAFLQENITKFNKNRYTDIVLYSNRKNISSKE